MIETLFCIIKNHEGKKIATIENDVMKLNATAYFYCPDCGKAIENNHYDPKEQTLHLKPCICKNFDEINPQPA